jgi:hypothetical protein
VQQPLAIHGAFFFTPEAACEITGLGRNTLARWMDAKASAYGHPLTVVKHQGRRLLDERDVHTLAAVQKDFPVGRGPIPPDRRDQMKRYAAQVRAKLTRE